MINRGVECLEAMINPNGFPAFKLLCDCGFITILIVEDLSEYSKTDAIELAYTCDSCSTSHWMTIEKVFKDEQ